MLPEPFDGSFFDLRFGEAHGTAGDGLTSFFISEQ